VQLAGLVAARAQSRALGGGGDVSEDDDDGFGDGGGDGGGDDGHEDEVVAVVMLLRVLVVVVMMAVILMTVMVLAMEVLAVLEGHHCFLCFLLPFPAPLPEAASSAGLSAAPVP